LVCDRGDIDKYFFSVAAFGDEKNMNMLINHFHLLRPWWLLLLLPLSYVLWRLWQYVQRHHAWETVCDPNLLPYLLQKRDRAQTHLPLLFLAMAWLCATLALAGPSWSQLSQQAYRSVAGNVIVFDMSPAMLQTDVQPDRFTRAKYKLIDLLKNSKEGAIGLVVYSGEAYSVAPVTNDSQTLINLATTLEPTMTPVSGYNLAQGLQLAEGLLQQSQAHPAAITLITGSTPTKAAIDMARRLAKKEITLNILGLGADAAKPETVELAQAGHGKYIPFTSSNADLQQLLNQLLATYGDSAIVEGEKISQWRDDGRWFLIPALILALLAFRRGWWEEI
jgi:Ca-activated chloride channel family protein